MDVDVPPPDRSATAAATPGIECSGDGTSGLRTLVVYARAADVADRYDTYVERIRGWAATADAVYQDSAAETGRDPPHPLRPRRAVRAAGGRGGAAGLG